jgi:predicted glutamine amidotransferase
MCVILTADKSTRLTADEIRAAALANRDGNGIAYLERGVVVWKKGISVDEAITIARRACGPVVFHARIATAGTVCAELCHPFPVSRKATGRETKGRNARVLFHNGHWHGWEDEREDYFPIAGPMSDSRFMAFLAAHDVDLDVVPESQRVVLFDRHGVERRGNGWSVVRPGVWASNRHWMDRMVERAPVLRPRARGGWASNATSEEWWERAVREYEARQAKVS